MYQVKPVAHLVVLDLTEEIVAEEETQLPNQDRLLANSFVEVEDTEVSLLGKE
jgi:hypothetical protein